MVHNNHLILTATRHLAEQLSEQASRTSNGNTAQSLSTWITRLCKPSLSESQEHAVWQSIIEKSLPHLLFLQHAQLATMAQQAWHLITQWDVPLSHASFENNNDTRLFKQWARAFTQQCERHQWLDASSAIEKYIAAPHHVPKHITLIGFTELTPQQHRLLKALAAQGCQYEFVKPTNLSHPQRIALADPETEWNTMARWAAYILAQNPQARIACVVPQLTENRLFIEDAFLKLKLPFTIAASQTLDLHSLIRCALSILSFSQNDIIPDKSHIISHSPFIKQPATETKKPTGLRLASEWSMFFTEQLETWGWPGNRTLEHTETQLYEQWQKALSDFAALDAILPTLSYEDALQHFQCIISSLSPNIAEYLPEGMKDNGHIQIFSPLDAIGLSFDALWLMGIQDTVWPPAPRPNPFIPISLQRSLHMPYASAEQTLQFYQKITASLCTQAPNIIVSYALRNADGELRPSSLIKTFSEITLAELPLCEAHNPTQQLFDAAQIHTPLEWISDEQAPPASANEVSHSGSMIFKNQAACPFRAFAHHRLGAKEIDSVSSELNYKERGTLIHKILEKIWIRLQDHTQLCHLPESELKNFINTCIHDTLTQFSLERTIPLKTRFQKIETERLEKLVWQWLMLEKERAFFKVKAVEKKQTLQLGQYPTHIRIDRIDELSDGSHIIIDYKTGDYTENSWYGDRPDEPQVPLYCIASEEPAMGAGVAQITSGNIALKGVISDTAASIGIKSLKPIAHWETLIQEWEIMLKNLIQQFESGYAAVAPKDPAKTCQYCHLEMVCRVKENL